MILQHSFPLETSADCWVNSVVWRGLIWDVVLHIRTRFLRLNYSKWHKNPNVQCSKTIKPTLNPKNFLVHWRNESISVCYRIIYCTIKKWPTSRQSDACPFLKRLSEFTCQEHQLRCLTIFPHIEIVLNRFITVIITVTEFFRQRIFI